MKQLTLSDGTLLRSSHETVPATVGAIEIRATDYHTSNALLLVETGGPVMAKRRDNANDAVVIADPYEMAATVV